MFSTLVFQRHACCATILDDTDKNSIKYEDIYELNDIMSELLENEKFSKFINCVSVCVCDTSHQRKNYVKLCANAADIDIDNIDNFESKYCKFRHIVDSITFSGFGLKFLDSILNRHLNRDDRFFILHGALSSNNISEVTSICDSNIDEDLTGFRGTFICKTHIFNIIKANQEQTYFKENISWFKHIVYIGPNNVLLAIISIDGEMLVRWQTVKSILKTHGREKTKEILEKLLHTFDEENDYFLKINSKEYIEHVAADILLHDDGREKFDNTVKALTDCSVISSRFVNFFSAYNGQLLESVRTQVHKKILHTMNICFEKLNIFAKLGWQPVMESNNINVTLNENQVWWFKDVNIVPDRYIRDDICWEIHPRKRSVHIIRLYINSRGVMVAEGDGDPHPNCSNDVCLGDLSIRMAGTPDEFEEDIKAAEKLLTLINFDSAYSSELLSPMSRNATKLSFDTSSTLYENILDNGPDLVRRAIPVDQSNPTPVVPRVVTTPTEVVIHSNDITSVNPEGFGSPVADSNTLRLFDMIRNIERSPYPYKNPSIKLDDDRLILWVIPGNRSFVAFDEYELLFWYIKDRYSVALAIGDNSIADEILSYCKILKRCKSNYCVNECIRRLSSKNGMRFSRSLLDPLFVERCTPNANVSCKLVDTNLVNNKLIDYCLTMNLKMDQYVPGVINA